MKDAEILLPGAPYATVAMVRSARARRMSLRVSQLDGRVRLTVPRHCPFDQAQAFVLDRADWVRKHLGAVEQSVDVKLGALIPFAGHDHEITLGRGRSINIEDGKIYVPADGPSLAPKIKAYFKQSARLALTRASHSYADHLNVSVGRISLKDTRTRWGSCSSMGNLNYSWRLIMAPSSVLDYVAAHEVAHRVEMNHSQDFWNIVQDLYPDHLTARAWLREHGTRLHKYRF